MLQKTTSHGHTVSYEENAHEGVRHLRDHLDLNEAKVVLDEARTQSHHEAEFEDRERRQYTLLYQKGVYVLVRR